MVSWNANFKNRKRITLDQERYTQKILEVFNMQYGKPSKTPAENNLNFEVAQEDSVRVDSHEFSRFTNLPS